MRLARRSALIAELLSAGRPGRWTKRPPRASRRRGIAGTPARPVQLGTTSVQVPAFPDLGLSGSEGRCYGRSSAPARQPFVPRPGIALDRFSGLVILDDEAVALERPEETRRERGEARTYVCDQPIGPCTPGDVPIVMEPMAMGVRWKIERPDDHRFSGVPTV